MFCTTWQGSFAKISSCWKINTFKSSHLTCNWTKWRLITLINLRLRSPTSPINLNFQNRVVRSYPCPNHSSKFSFSLTSFPSKEARTQVLYENHLVSAKLRIMKRILVPSRCYLFQSRSRRKRKSRLVQLTQKLKVCFRFTFPRAMRFNFEHMKDLRLRYTWIYVD